MDRAAVLGLGLIGGSVARDLAARGVRVQGYDRDPATLHAALDEGILDRALDESLEGVGEADLIVIAVPVATAADVLEQVAPHLGADCVATDVGSTKRSIVEAAIRLGIGERFVGSHPLEGDHRSGWDASRTGLFHEARVFLCPTLHSLPSAVDRVREMWRSVGARPQVIDADEHDRCVAWSSHLPQATSTALAVALAAAGIPRSELGPGGRDVTRLAASSPEVWSAICLDNADAIADALASLEMSVGSLRSAVMRGDEDEIRRLLVTAHEWSLSD